METFKPSQVVLGVPPLTACFEKTEAECAAGLLVFLLARDGDEWKPIKLQRMGELMGEAINAKTEPVVSWARNPFFRPDFPRLVDGGYVEQVENENGKHYAFTDKGRERLARWVPSQQPATSGH